MSCPDPYAWMTSGPYEGHTVTYIATVNGYDMYYATGPGGMYCSLNPVDCSEVGGMSGDRASHEAYLMSLPYPGDPIPQDPYVVEVYLGIEIYHDPVAHNYYFEFCHSWPGLCQIHTFSDTTPIESLRTAIDDLVAGPEDNNLMLKVTMGLMLLFGVSVFLSDW